ncbi:MAG: hypothetical protein HYW06_10995, partial [Gemmatimonadetes bacterium]|nr:hypothetical protein [Gemmatimonadota bacterium]
PCCRTVYEYPDRDLTFMYSATLANGNHRGLVFMGHDASMRVSGALAVSADQESTRLEQKINDIIDLSRPMFTCARSIGPPSRRWSAAG